MTVPGTASAEGRGEHRALLGDLESLVSARWALLAFVGLLAVAVATTSRGLDLASAGLPPSSTRHGTGFFAVWLAWAALNLWTARRVVARHGARRVTPSAAGLHLIADVGAVTGLLAFSGAASNPFTALYFVPIALATQVSPRWAWGVGASALLGFGVLLWLGPDVPPGPHAHHFVGHLRGMWIALGVSGSVLTYFVHRMAVARARERAELEQLRRAALEDRHLTALGTLAAGAAHELATPLGTVRVLSEELPYMDDDERTDAVEGIKQAVARCKAILARMASPELRVEAMGVGAATPWSVAELAPGLATLGSERVRVTTTGFDEPTVALSLPREAIDQVLRELVHNAVQASETAGESAVEVSFESAGGEAVFIVRDHAGGLAEADEGRVHEPFFSGRAQGEGMGLGLYLVHAHVRQLGGEISLDNRSGTVDPGLTATVSFPSAISGRAPAPGATSA